MTRGCEFSTAGRFLISAAAFVILVAGMRASASLLTPFMLSLFMTILATPPLELLRRQGLPLWLALLLVISGVVSISLLLGWLIGNSLEAFSANLPGYQERLGTQTDHFLSWLQSLGVEYPSKALAGSLDPGKVMGLVGDTLGRLGNLLTNALLILLTAIFMLLESSGFPAKLQAALRRPEESLVRLQHITANINRYMAIKTVTSLITGVVIAVWLWILGIDFPELWGVVAFLFNFVPNIGSIIAAVPAVLLALIQLGPVAALWVAGGYLVVNNLIGNLVEPRFMGKGLGLSTLVVFLSLVFWGWVLGPVGMFLSVPLTMSLKIALDSNEETRPIAVLLGSDTHPS